MNHSILAAAHKKLADWCNYYCAYKSFAFLEMTKEKKKRLDLIERIENTMGGLIGTSDLSSLQPAYHYEMAMRHYRYALETHSEGRSYRQLIEDMVYLNDDFNDSLYHFSAATERYRINTFRIHNEIDLVSELIKQTKLYTFSNYGIS